MSACKNGGGNRVGYARLMEAGAHAFLGVRIARFWVLSTLISDCGSQFEPGMWFQFMTLLGIHCTQTTSNHPCANRMVEKSIASWFTVPPFAFQETSFVLRHFRHEVTRSPVLPGMTKVYDVMLDCYTTSPPF